MRRISISIVAIGALLAGAPAALAQENTPAYVAPPPPAGILGATEPQPETLLSGNVSHGGFGGPVMGFTTIRDQAALLMGGRGGWLINHRLVIGGGGYGVTHRLDVPGGATVADADYQTMFGYGGFWTEYIVAPSRLVHGSVGLLIGAGSLKYHRFRHSPMVGGDSDDDAFFVLDPTVSVELNVVSFMRLALFANYRRVWGVDLTGMDNGDVSGVGAGAMLKFGRF